MSGRVPGPRPERTAPDIASQADDVVTALKKLAAAVWLMDAIDAGELGFLKQEHGTSSPPWWTGMPFPMTGTELTRWLMDMSRQYAAEALDETHRAATALQAALTPTSAEVAR